jgi:hypothetical protein
MASKFFKNFYERKTIKEQVADLAKRSAVTPTGKIKNMKAKFNGAKKKAGTMNTGSQRGS